MKSEDSWLIVIVAAILLISLFGGYGMMGYGGYRGMMGNWNYGSMMGGGYGFGGMWIIGWIFMILAIIALVLFILWLIKQLESKKRTRK